MVLRAQAQYTVSGASVRALLGYTKSLGAEVSGFLESAGLVEAALLGPESRVTQSASDVLWDRCALATSDACFGLHFAERVDLDGFHVVGHLATTSKTLGEALNRIVAFSRLLHDAGRTELELDGALVHVFPGCRGLPQPASRHIAEFSAATVVLLGQMITGESWKPTAVAFQHGAPSTLTEHKRVFGVTPSFLAAETVVSFPRKLLELPVKNAPSQIGGYLEAYAQELLKKLPPENEDLRARVSRAILIGIARSDGEIGSVASHLAMTPRTLQRRLADAGTTFAELADEARRVSAERYLSDELLPIAEISFLLGFQEASSFHKAFRRWTGTTPGEYRERALSAAGAPAQRSVARGH